MQAWFWGGVAAMLILVVAGGVAERRRGRRADWDRVGLIYWPGVQVFALIAAFLLALLALRA